MRVDPAKIVEVLKSLPFASATEIASAIWPHRPKDILRGLAEHVTTKLQQLDRFSLVVHDTGWRLARPKDPFKLTVETQEDNSALASTLCSLAIRYFGSGSLSYFGSAEQRLAAVMSAFVADSSKDLEQRRQVYISLLVLCVPVKEWPKEGKDIVIPDDIDWEFLKTF
ncbi:MAG: hypothetical protein ACO1RT_03170 [Planctomycetaceae bacterium]